MKSSLKYFVILISSYMLIIVSSKDNDAVVLKNRVWDGYQTNIGAHYYAYSPYSTEYSIVTTYIKLPNQLYIMKGKRIAYISLGVLGLYGAIELGIANTGNGWYPYYYDNNTTKSQTYTNFNVPLMTKIIAIQIEVNSRRIIIFSLSCRTSSLQIINSFQVKISATHLLVYENNKVKFRFFRFVKLSPTGVDNQNDGTFMIGGQFTELTIIKNGFGRDWGLNTDDIDVAWKVSSQKIQISYDDRTDIFDIKHEDKDVINKLTDEEIQIFKNLPELRFSSLSIKLNPNEDSIKLKMKVPFEDCFEFFSPNKNEIDINIYSTSGEPINLSESCFSFQKDDILYIKIKAIIGGNINIPMKFKKYKNYLPYHPIDKNIGYDSFDNKGLNEPFEIKYEKRKGDALYINCNNPEKLYKKDLDKAIIRNKINNQEVFFTMEHNCQYEGGYMGYRLKNTGNNDLYVTIRNLGYYISPLGGKNADWTGQKEWVDFYNINFRFRNKEKLSAEDLDQLNELIKEEYWATPKVPITYRIPPGKYIYVLGGTSEDAFNNINVFDTANIKISNRGISNGAVLFDVKGTAEACLYYYTNYKSIKENDQSLEYLINGIDYSDDYKSDFGAQYKGYDEHHGVIDGYAFWKINDETPSDFLPVKVISYYRNGEKLTNQEPYSEILNTQKHENIVYSWITNANPQNLDMYSSLTIGTDIMDFNIYTSDLKYIVIDNNHYDGRGMVANTANWMVHYITSYRVINLGNRDRELTISIAGHGVIACFVVDSNGYVVSESEQFSLYKKIEDTNKEIVHEFTYTSKIKAKSSVKFYVEHNLLANSYGKVIHRAKLN